MSKSGKQYLKPGFLANKNQTDHGRKSNKKSKANDTTLKATGFKHTTPSPVHPIRLNGNGKRIRTEVNDLDYNPSGEEDDSDDDSIGSFEQEATEIPDQMESSLPPQSPRSTTGSQLANPHNGANDGFKISNRGRSVARGFEVKRRMKTGGKIGGVIFDEDKWLPVGPAEKLFKMEIGIITRLLVPLNVFYWKRMTAAQKAPLFERLESEFDLKFEDQHTRNVVDNIMARRFRLFKHRCHLHYKKFSVEEAPQHPPLNVDPIDWIPLCEHFETTDFKKQSAAGKKNRGDLEVNHTSGSKSFLQRLYEMENPEKGKEPEEPSQVKLYKETHVHTKNGPKKGAWVHPKAAENHEKMEMLKNQQMQEDGNKLTEDDIREEILKTKTGYSRGLGYGVKPCKTIASGASVRIQAQQTKAAEKRAEAADKRAEEANKRAEETDKRAAEAEKQAQQFHEEIQVQRSTITKLEESQLDLKQAFQRFVARFGDINP